MRMSAVLPALSSLTGDRRELPGLTGPARVDRDGGDLGVLVKRLREGDVAVIDRTDLDRASAELLIEARVVAVVNAAPSISGRFPNMGPEALLEAGIALVDDAGPDLPRNLRDGTKLRLHDGGIFAGERLLARGVPQTPDTVGSAMARAKEGLVNQLEAFSANTIEFIRQDRALLLDGVGVPDVRVRLADRHVLVVAPGSAHREDLARLRRYIKEYRPVLVGVGAGADALCAAGHRPDLVVGDPGEMSEQALTCGADVVVPAFADGHAPGLHLAQDCGVGAVTFPASGNPEDLALLLAHHHGAGLIVTVGFEADLAEFLDRGRSGRNASTFLTRLKVGGLLVDGKAAAALYRSPVSVGAIVLLVLAVLGVLTVAIAVTAVGPALLSHLGRVAVHVTQLVTGWLHR